LPKNMSSKCLVDVGSRLGVALYYVRCFKTKFLTS
jgi:hypothetical protein